MVDDYNKLNCVRLPFYQRWFSSLKNKNISFEDYIQANKLFNKHNFKSMFDFLEHYNICVRNTNGRSY